jgi:purine-nucleoside/S-methyl-5'-thioadenosine phosphorylase / adenosine deaminase
MTMTRDGVPVRCVTEVVVEAVPALVHAEWLDRFPWLVQGTTTRGGDENPFDLGLFGEGCSEEDVLRNWGRLVRRTGSQGAVHARQLHGSQVTVHTPTQRTSVSDTPTPDLGEPSDGHLIARAGVLATVATADCVPVFMVDAGTRAVGAVHAGWRGAAKGVLERGLAALIDGFGGAIEEVHIHLGPAICGDCYEVGSEVFEALGQTVPADAAPIDLRAVLADRAVATGVHRDHVTASTHCTRCTGSDLFSHRAGDPFRQVGYIGVRRAQEPRLSHPAGLCGTCRHHRVIGNRRGSRFYLCELAGSDGRFRRYPPLPVLRCEGFAVGDPDLWADYVDEADGEPT